MQWLKRYIPLLEDLSGYSGSFFRNDLMAGLTVGVMLVPQGMAYAYLSGMPPIYGLYAGLVPLLAYAVFGSSRHLAVGPVAVSALLVFAGLNHLAPPFSPEYIELAIFTGMLIGFAQILLSVLRLGILVNFISHPVISGFTSAAAIIVVISQLKDIFGMDVPRFENSVQTLRHVVSHLHEINWLTFLLSIGSLAVLMLIRKYNRRLPGAVMVVAASTLLSWVFDFGERGVAIVDDVPGGFPGLSLPEMSFNKFKLLIPTVFTVAAISIVESLGIAKFYEGKSKSYRVMNNQELFALGLANVLGSFTRSMPISGSFSRSAVNYSAQGKTGVSSVVTAIVVGLSILFLTPLFRHLPLAVLAAIILLAVINLFDYAEASRLWRVHKRDFLMLMTTFLGTLLLGIEMGVLLGFGLSIITVLYRSSMPNISALGRIKGTTYFRSKARYPNLEAIPNTLILRFDDQLYYANANYFKDKLSASLRETKKGDAFILDASNIHDIDSTGLTVLGDLMDQAKQQGVSFSLCNLVEQVEDVLIHAQLLGVYRPEITTYNSIHEAVLSMSKGQGQ